MKDKLNKLWRELYGKEHTAEFERLLSFLEETKQKIDYLPEDKLWYKRGIVYSLYVDLFAEDFKGLTDKLDYLEELGITILWLLPILESPMVDQGFDVADYYQVREELGSNEDFFTFIDQAHEKGIKIIFDIPINHTSEQHPWFINARQSKAAEYRDFYIWSENTDKYEETRLLLKGISNSNWTYNPPTDDYYFHRFYDIQPDLNYKNPQVLIEMIKVFCFWKQKGMDGFRMDAAPFLWKEEGTNCENLPQTHTILKLYRTALDYLGAGTAIIAEANQKPADVVDYLGQGDECHVAYNFPIMPKFYLAVAEGKPDYLLEELAANKQLQVPQAAQWFTFLRCHDELTLEFVTDKEREKMLQYYLKESEWSFREGEGIAGRIYDLFTGNPDKVLLAYSLLFSIEGTPIIYYGDEIGMENDTEFYRRMNEKTGYVDSRFLNRGPFSQSKRNEALADPESDSYQIFHGLQAMIRRRKNNKQLFVKRPEYRQQKGVFIAERTTENKQMIIYNNLRAEEVEVAGIKLPPYGYKWEFITE